jgi:hypothetical protein
MPEAELNGAPVKLQVFALRSMVNGAAFHRAYQRATQQAFLKAHEWPSIILTEFFDCSATTTEERGEAPRRSSSAGRRSGAVRCERAELPHYEDDTRRRRVT